MHKDNDSNQNDVAAAGGLKGRHLIVLMVIAAAVVAGFYYLAQRRAVGPKRPGKEKVVQVPEGSRAATLFFADSENEALIGETRQVAIGRDFTEEVKQIMEALLEGPEYAGVSAIPDGTRILDVFYDSESRILYLDFSSELVAGHPGGSSAEYYTIAAIMRTASENFPEVNAVQFLVEGLQMDTIGGHLNAHKPFLVKDWR